MTSWLSGGWLTGGWILVSIALGIVALGLLGALAMGAMKGVLWLFTLTYRVVQWTWARMTGTPLDSHGSAHMASMTEIAAAGLLNDTGISLAQLPDGRILREPLGQHVSLCAPPRSHKSWGLMRPAIQQYQGSVVASDPRGELYQLCHEARESYGPVFRFAPMERSSCQLNPLSWVRWGQDQEYADVQRITHALLSPEPGEPRSEFQMEAEPFLTSLVLHLRTTTLPSFGGVLRFLTDPGSSMSQKLEGLLRSPLPLVASGARRMMDKSDRQRGAVLMALESALNVFSDPLIDEKTSTSDLDVGQLQGGLQPVSLFLCVEFADVRRLRPLMGCLVEQMIARFGAPGQTKRRTVLLALDEFTNLGYLPSLEVGMSHLAGDGCQVMCCYQNRAQVTHVYGLHSPVLDSIPTALFYTPEPMDRTTLDEISTALGSTTSIHATTSESRSVFGLVQRTMHGEQRHERPLRYPDEIARMSDESCILLTKGHPPVQALKLDATPAAILAMVQRSKPVVRKVALAAAACLVVGLVGTWALWPSAQPKPSLSLTPLAWLPQGTVQTPEPAQLAQTPTDARQEWIDKKVAALQADGWSEQRIEAQRQILQGVADAASKYDRPHDASPDPDVLFASMPGGLRPRMSPMDLSTRSDAAQAEIDKRWVVWSSATTPWVRGPAMLSMLRKHHTRELCEADAQHERTHRGGQGGSVKTSVYCLFDGDETERDEAWQVCSQVKVAKALVDPMSGKPRNFVAEESTRSMRAIWQKGLQDDCPQIVQAKAQALAATVSK